jgi:hypothetical protein
MAALQTTTQGKPRAIKQARDFTKSELGNGLPTKDTSSIAATIAATTEAVTHRPTSILRDGLVPRVTRMLAAFYDSLNRPAMSHRERDHHKTVAAARERDKFWSGTDIFFMGP